MIPNHPPQPKRCTRCHQVLPTTAFGRRTASPDGLQYMCKACIREIAERKKQERTDHGIMTNVGMKCCSECRQVKPLEAFHRRAASLDGRQYKCKECFARAQNPVAFWPEARIHRARRAIGRYRRYMTEESGTVEILYIDAEAQCNVCPTCGELIHGDCPRCKACGSEEPPTASGDEEWDARTEYPKAQQVRDDWNREQFLCPY